MPATVIRYCEIPAKQMLLTRLDTESRDLRSEIATSGQPLSHSLMRSLRGLKARFRHLDSEAFPDRRLFLRSIQTICVAFRSTGLLVTKGQRFIIQIKQFSKTRENIHNHKRSEITNTRDQRSEVRASEEKDRDF